MAAMTGGKHSERAHPESPDETWIPPEAHDQSLSYVACGIYLEMLATSPGPLPDTEEPAARGLDDSGDVRAAIEELRRAGLINLA
jgi:hypothetical protein